MEKLVVCEIHWIQQYIYWISINKLALKRLKWRSQFIVNKIEQILKNLQIAAQVNEVIVNSWWKFIVKVDLEEDVLIKFSTELEKEIFEEFNWELKVSFVWDEWLNLSNLYKKQWKAKLQLFKNIEYEKLILPFGSWKREKEKICKWCNKWKWKLYKKEDFLMLQWKLYNDFDAVYWWIICDKCKSDILLSKDIKFTSFEDLLNKWNSNDQKWYSKLAVLKWDFDDLWKITAKMSLEKLKEFSIEMDIFTWSFWKEKKWKIEKIYAGWDDFVFIGRWNDIVDFASEIWWQADIWWNKITFSCSIYLFNEKQKIYWVIERANQLLQDAKSFQSSKNSINFLSQSMKYNDFEVLVECWNTIYEKYKEIVSDGFWYFLLKRSEEKELRENWKNNKNWIKQWEWLFDYKWKMIYSLSRNYYKDNPTKDNDKLKMQFVSLINQLFELKFKKFEYETALNMNNYDKKYLKQLILYILMKKRDDITK